MEKLKLTSPLSPYRQMLFENDPQQPDIGAVNTINYFAEPRNANGSLLSCVESPVPVFVVAGRPDLGRKECLLHSLEAFLNIFRVGVNTTTPPGEKINSINSWADVRNAEVRV